MSEREAETAVDIEEIMEQIRHEILAKSGGVPVAVGVSGRRFPPDFYDHLYQVSLTYHQLEAKLHLTPVNVPLVGPLVQWLRRKLHEVVIFYVNQIAVQQIKINSHFLQALTLMSQALEEDVETRRQGNKETRRQGEFMGTHGNSGELGGTQEGDKEGGERGEKSVMRDA